MTEQLDPQNPDSPDERARITEAQMTDDERFSLLVSLMGQNPIVVDRDPRIPEGTPMSAGYVPGVPRLGVPALLMSDAGLGVTNPGYRPGDSATALPAGLALGSSFNRELSRSAGGLLGREARSRGFNVQLAAGANLVRDPRNGRNFEYLSEDPLLSAELAAETVNGIQAEGVISTIKHFSLNSNETNRQWLDAIIDPAAHREADLLVFEIAIELSQPGTIMAGYNKINGAYATGNEILLTEVLKGAWKYPGWVMSDWGATPTWESALAGLDQESGLQLDLLIWGAEAFTDRLRAAHADGRLPKERLSDMVRRILRSMYAVGVDAWGPAPEADPAAHDLIALEGARQGTVLLKNDDGILPLSDAAAPRIAVIGGHAQVGVLAGCGSSTVLPSTGYNEIITVGGPGMMGPARNLYLYGDAPFDTLRAALPNATLEFDPGISPAEAALMAKRCDIAVVFAFNLMGEGFDNGDIDLPWGQNEVITAVAAANPNTVVVLETGSAVRMPWNDSVKAVVEAWYPGQAGGRAIAEVLTGAVNPSGHLPMTFPVGLEQTPRPEFEGQGSAWATPVTIDYHEGAEVGYRWFAQTGDAPLYAFGHGLSYTTFDFADLVVTGGDTVTAAFTVTNTGDRAGAPVPQVYLTHVDGAARQRLLGFDRVELQPGEQRRIEVTADPRLLAHYDSDAGRWAIDAGSYRIALSYSAVSEADTADVSLSARVFGR
jgi:beta-glucosidase